MFLQEVKEAGIPDLDFLDSKSLNKRYAYRQRLRQDLRKRFRSEYLGQLRQYEKKMRNSKSHEIGDVVLIFSDNTKRLDWSSRKVIELFMSPDQNIRLVKLKTKNGEVLRPVLRLHPLEVTEHERVMCQKYDKPETFTYDETSELERYFVDKTESYEPTSRYGRKLKQVETLVL
ncbi:integrase catalytic domain-containing protein [Nephila pilipes]|uniref:Integrase catalytic domain-containing protein n=1 Tax=Nephila pilipes TaxID=299642 RepID=A0A8X6KIT0_NEPPI|nr:integrase catalytic domain-containing protein [Nephila pilipes]